MRIGIAGPIEIESLKSFLPNLSVEDLKLGLGGTAVNLIIKGLINEGHHVTVFTLDVNVKNKKIIEGDNLKIIFGHFRTSAKIKMFDFCRKEFLQIKKFIELEKDHLDIVNAHWSYEFAIGTILANVTHIITFRDHSPTILKLTKHPYRCTRLLMDFWVRRKAKAFSYNSEYLKKLIGIKGEVIPNPIKISNKQVGRSFPGENNKFNMFFIANGWDYRKNPETAIKAFNLIRKKHKNVSLHLIGSGFENKGEGYNNIEKKYSLEGIIFHGFIKHNQLKEKLKACDIMLHTSREESFGNNLVEAMAFGIPVIGGEKAGAVPWVLDYGNAGILVNVEDEFDVSKAIKKLITNKQFYEQLSIKGLENVRKRFSLKIVANKYFREYKLQIQNQK